MVFLIHGPLWIVQFMADHLKHPLQMESQQNQAQDLLPIIGIFHPEETPPVAVQLVKFPCPKI